MKKIFALSVFGVAIVGLTGCQSPPLPVYTISLREKPTVADVRCAEDCLERLPSALWMPERHVQIEPGVGFTAATIAQPASEAMENCLLNDLLAFNANHPMEPVHLQVK